MFDGPAAILGRDADGNPLAGGFRRSRGPKPAAGRGTARERGFDGLAFSPDSKWLAGFYRVPIGAPVEVKLWNSHTGEELRTFQGHDEAVLAAVFSPDGKLLATASADRTARLWDVETGEELRILRGHVATLCAVAFSPDGKRLVTASADGTLRVWETATGREVLTLKGHSTALTSVTFSPDGRHIVTGDDSGVVKIWTAAPWDSE